MKGEKAYWVWTKTMFLLTEGRVFLQTEVNQGFGGEKENLLSLDMVSLRY